MKGSVLDAGLVRKDGVLEKDLGRLQSRITKTRNKAAERTQERHNKRQWLWGGERGGWISPSFIN